MDDVNEILKNFVDGQLKAELDARPTFTEEMAEHIRNVYADLRKQKEEWLKSKKKNKSKS